MMSNAGFLPIGPASLRSHKDKQPFPGSSLVSAGFPLAGPMSFGAGGM